MKIQDIKPDQAALTPEQQKRVSLVEDRAKDGAHTEEDLQSYIQLAYYAGHQWIALQPSTKQVVPLPKEPWQSQYVANRIMPCVRTELAKITRNKLTKKVVPASSEDEDIRAARLAEKVVEWMEYELKLQEQDEEAIMWALVTRIGFVKLVWNPNKGMVVATEDGKEVKEGDIDIEVLNLFELKWDPSASRWEDVRWLIHERQRTVDYVREVYGVEVEPEEDLIAANIYEGKLKGLQQGSGFIGSQPVKAKDCVVVREYWTKPCADYPRGAKITVAAGRELDFQDDIGFGEEDLSEREFPIFPLIHIPMPGKIIGSSVVEQLMPVQREYNRSRAQIIENKNLMANPKWLAEVGSILNDEIDSSPGTVVWYLPGFNAPVMSQPAALGPEVTANIERCLEEFMFISGQQEVSHGSTPSGVSSGIAIELLQEQDDTKLAPSIAKYGRFKQAYLSYGLKIIKHRYTEERTLQLVGSNKRVEMVQLRGSDLSSTDVRLEDMSLTQLSSAARKQYILELISMGVLNPQLDRDLILRMLELGISDELYDASEQDVQQAMNENALWAKGDFSPITRDFYNHEVHVAQHNKYRKSDEYDVLSPDQQMAIDAHVEEHMMYLMQAMMPQEPVAGAEQAEGTAPGVDMGKVVSSLSTEEQAALQENPNILDQM